MKAKPIKQVLMALVLGLVMVSCGPSYIGVNGGYGPRYRYHDPYVYRRPQRVIVTPPPRVYYRSPRYYKPAPPAYGRRYGYRGRGRW